MASNPRQELDELRKLEALEKKASTQVIDTSRLKDPHEIQYIEGMRGHRVPEDQLQDDLKQYRAIKKADRGMPTMGQTKIPTTKGEVQPSTPIAANPEANSEPAPTPNIPPTKSVFEPRVGLEDLKGPVGQSALTAGLATSAFVPGLYKIPAFLAGGGAAILAEEGTRRLQEGMGDIPGYLTGLALSMIAGGGAGMAGRTPSHPSKIGRVTIESPETNPLLGEPQPAGIPPTKGLYESIPRGGAYSSQEILTPPSSRISAERQFSTGSGESLFGEEFGGQSPFNMRSDLPLGPLPEVNPLGTRLWADEGIRAPLQEKYPTIEQTPISPKQLEFEAKQRGPQKPPSTPLVDTGTIGNHGEYVPPKDYIEPPLPSKWRQVWNAEKQRWGQEYPVLKTHPDSPVISGMEATHVSVEDFMERYVQQPWIKSLMKFGDNTKLAQLEKKWIEDYKAGRDPSIGMPDNFKQMFQRMDSLLAEENAINRRRGLPEIKKVEGPYAPRLTDEDFKLMRSITRSHEGAKTSQGIGPFQETRGFETLDEGLRKGITYKDWRHSLLMREARGSVLRATDQLMTDLEQAGVIFKTKEGAEAASLTKRAYPADGLPFSPKEGKWWVRSAEERQFLLQNMRQMGTGTLQDIRQWAQQWLRNPSLVNPWPHIVKNMGLKQMQQAIAGGLRPDQVFKQGLVYRHGNPDMLEEFKQVMPFTKSGQTVWEIMEQAGPKTMVQRLSRVPGQLNSYARRKIFAEWDPAMRYGLWREYVRKGMSPQEAANHTWIDLIRYGTRADRIDFWNSVPFNFFVPWRVGTLRTMNKALQTAPVRTAAFIGATDFIRELDYRYNGRWTHLPYDYWERPIMTLLNEGPKEAGKTALATMIAGPGGEYMFRTIQNLLNTVGGKGGIGDIRTIAWGLAQVYDLWPQYTAWEKDHDPRHITDMLGLVLLGRHATPFGGPHRFGELIPENLIRTVPYVKQAEEQGKAVRERSEARQEHTILRDVEKMKEPFPQAR